MKYILTQDEQLLLEDLLFDCDIILEKNVNISDIEHEEKKELSKWRKILNWAKRNKTKIAINLTYLISFSIIVGLIIKLMKKNDDSNAILNNQIDNFKQDVIVNSDINNTVKSNTITYLSKLEINNDLENNFKNIRAPIDWHEYTPLRKEYSAREIRNMKDSEFDEKFGFNKILRDIGLDKDNAAHVPIIKKFRENAFKNKIISGWDVDDWTDAVITVGKKYNKENIPATWNLSDADWKLQTYLYSIINGTKKRLEMTKNEVEPEFWGDILNKYSDAIKDITMSYTGKKRRNKIDALIVLKDKVDSMITEIFNKHI